MFIFAPNNPMNTIKTIINYPCPRLAASCPEGIIVIIIIVLTIPWRVT
jgi:hypothetical protein